MKRVLVTGAGGQLGRSIQDRASKYPSMEFLFLDRDGLDITNPQQVERVFKEFQPHYCVNCAAYTQVDLSEQEYDKARLINVEAVGNIIGACNQRPCTLFHISTDFVFDGKSEAPYTESSTPNPLSIYGQTKLQGEERVARDSNHYVIIRTSWVFSEFGKNFVKTMLRLSATHPTLRVVDDQMGCPTYAGDLAEQILEIILSGKGENESYHFCNQGATTWHDFAKAIFKLAGRRTEVVPITSEDFGAAAPRPAYSVLDCSKIKNVFGKEIRPWHEALRDCLQRLKGIE